MALPNRRSFSKESSDIHLTGRLCCGEDWGMYGNYPNDSKLRGKYPKLDALEYLDNYAALPADRPVGYPHLINMDKYQEHIQRQGLRIADAVVTVLYNWEPEALTAFLDDDLEDFRFQVVDFSDHPQNFYVQRKRRRVECGWVGHDTHVYWIEDSGEWTPDIVCVSLRDCVGERKERKGKREKAEKAEKAEKEEQRSAHQRATAKDGVKEQVNRKLGDGEVERGQVTVRTAAGFRDSYRPGFLDKVEPQQMMDDGVIMAADVLTLPVWEASPWKRFKTIGVRLKGGRKDTDALDG